ncbi:hypothetical protein P3342_001845 [Pyrenophora teres f. teres]|nr:hypothetical protein P3342_001845 [Pyrenophora teres f. teres]
MDGPPPMMNGGGGLGGSAWGPAGHGPPPMNGAGGQAGGWANAPNFTPRGRDGPQGGGGGWGGAPRGNFDPNAYGKPGGGGSGGARGSGDGAWKDGKHVLALPTSVSNAISLVSPTTPQSSKPVSISKSTMISPSRLLAKAFPNPSHVSRTRPSMTIC